MNPETSQAPAVEPRTLRTLDTDVWALTARRATVVATAFALVTAGFLLGDYSRRLVKDPLDSTEFLTLKQQLVELKKQPPGEEVQSRIQATVEAIRASDLALREAYFRQRNFARRGAWLLLAAIVILVIAAKTAATLRRKLPAPQPAVGPQDLDARRSHVGRWAVAALGLVLVAAALGLRFGSGTSLTLPLDATKLASSTSTGSDAAVPMPTTGAQAIAPAPNDKAETDPSGGSSSISREETPHPRPPQPRPDGGSKAAPNQTAGSNNWPRFRGPLGSGISAFDDVPTQWDVASGNGIAWKVPVPAEGNSSPIVWNDRIFLTGATAEKRQVFCFATADGKLLWAKDVPGTPPSTAKPPEVMEDTGFAALTPATDGQRVYVGFANGDYAAFDFTGNIAWSHSLGIPKNAYGHASSVVLAGNYVIIQLDQGSARDGLSKLIALDSATGKTVWETKRDVPSSWSTPLVIDVGGQSHVVTAGDPWAIAYRTDDGKEVWRAKCLKQDVGPSPVFHEGVVFVATEYLAASAIRADGQGDVTASHILWSAEDDIPDTCSPLVTGPHVLLLTSAGTLSAYDTKTGKRAWFEEFDSTFKASPAMAGKHVYLFGAGEEGKVFVIEPGAKGPKKVFETQFAEPLTASPAFQPGRMYVRSKSHLFCIGKK